MRLIDADALIEAMGEEPYVWMDSAEEIAERNQWLTDMHIIEEAPSIDICFCRECKKANTEDCSLSYWDDDWGVWRIGYKGDEWFCADGEREGE